MSRYLVRVELFHAKGDDYSALHDGMKFLGLDRVINFEDGKKYEMPTGTYFGASSMGCEALRDRVRSTANPHSPYKDAAVFVSECSDWSAWLYAD